MNGDPEHFVVDVGYRDPLDDDARDLEGPDPPTADEVSLDPLVPFGELDHAQLEHELAFGSSGVRQVLARDELLRRSGGGYQPKLFGPLDRLNASPKR